MNNPATPLINNNFLETAKRHQFLTFLGGFYILSVIIGAYRFYTPLPQGDMWDGYINFYLQTLNGDYSAWLAQHNEHRPTLSRIFFFIDIKYFNGLSATLIPLNIFFLVSVWLTLLSYASRFLRPTSDSNTFFYFIILLTVFSFSWKQDENITWAFQSQFWLAYLLPLLSYTLMAASSENKKHSTFYFISSCLAGIMAAGTMANGILTLPLLTLMAIIKRHTPIKTIALSLISIIIIYLYLSNYQTPANHQSLINNIITRPFDVALFFIEYLGAPFKSLVLSFALSLLHLYFIVQIFRHKDKIFQNSYYLAAVIFVAYYLATAFITSAGRVDLGIKAALVSRYTTPGIISLALCAILYLSIKPEKLRFINKRNITILAILMLGTQARTIIKNTEKIHDNDDIQALQFELGVHRENNFQRIADLAAEKNISIFGIQPFMDKRPVLKTKINIQTCSRFDKGPGVTIEKSAISVDNILPVDISNSLASRSVLYLTNQQDTIVSMALVSRLNKNSANLIITKDMLLAEKQTFYLYGCQ